MTHRLTANYAKNYCTRTFIVKVIVENVVTCFFWDTVYSPSHERRDFGLKESALGVGRCAWCRTTCVQPWWIYLAEFSIAVGQMVFSEII